MGNILQDMMGLLSRKKVVTETEPTDLILLGRTPNPDDSMFVTPNMNNQLISIKDLRAEFDEGEISGGGTLNTIPLFTPDGTTLGDSIITQALLGQGVTVSGGLDVLEDLNVTGSIETSSNLEVTGTTSLNGPLEVNSTYYDAAGDEGTDGDVLVAKGSPGNMVTRWVSKANTDIVTGEGTTNTLPIWTDGPNGELGDSQVTQTKIDGGTVFNLNAVTTTIYTPAINTKLLDLNSGGVQKFSITQDGGGGVILPAGGGVTNPGPSFNMGGGAFSNGKSGVAMGTTTTAFGNGSLAANFLTLASGGGASAFGLLSEAAGLASASFGNKSKASGNYSISSGQDTIASGQSAVAIGEKGDAQGNNTFVSGFGGTATANNAVKFGYEGSASGNNSAKFGFESVASGANSFAIGDGTTASGFQSMATGDNNVVSNGNSFVGGKNSTVTGAESISFGINNTVSANTCAIFGNNNSIPNGGFQSFIAGSNNTAGTLGRQKLIGVNLQGASTQDGVYLGVYNDNTDIYNKFQIGNGTSLNRSNSLSINNAGHVKLPTYGSGSVTGTATRNLSVDVDGRIIETNNPSAPDYLSAVLLLTQSGANAPVNSNLLENGLGIPVPFNWTRVSSGEYNLNATGKFKLLKTIVFINGGSAENNHDVAWEVIDADNLRIRTHNSDDKLTKASLEIRTYN